MKKIFMLIILAALIGVGVYKYLPQSTELSVEKALPHGAIGLIHLTDIEENLKELEKNPIYQTMLGLNYALVMREMGMTDEQFARFNEEWNKALSDENIALLKTFFGRDVAIAAYPTSWDFSKMSRLDTHPEESFNEIFSSFYIVSKMNSGAKFAGFLSKLYAPFSNEVETSEEKYLNQTINIVAFPNLKMDFAYTVIDDYLIISASKLAISNSIDAYEGETVALAEDEEYLAAKNNTLKDATSFYYWNIDKFFDGWEKQLLGLTDMYTQSGQSDQYADKIMDEMDETLKSIKGITSLLASSKTGPLTTSRFVMNYDTDQMDPLMAMMYNCKNRSNETIDFVPEKTLAYSWNNCLNTDAYWKYYSELLPAENISQVEAGMGLSFAKDIVPAFGTSYGVVLEDIKSGGFFALPQLSLYVEVRDLNKAKKVINTLLGKIPFAQLQKADYEGVSIHAMPMAMSAGLQPGYAFFKDYFILSIDKKLIQNIINTDKGKSESLVKNDAFKNVDFGLTGKGTDVQFYRLGEIMSRLSSLIEMGNSWLSSTEGKKGAFKSGTERRVQDLKTQIQSDQSLLNEKLTLKDELDIKLSGLVANGDDTTQVKSDLVTVSSDIAQLEAIISENRQIAADLLTTVEGYDKPKNTVQARRLALDEVVYPMLESMKAISSMGSVTTMSKDALETNLYIKIDY